MVKGDCPQAQRPGFNPQDPLGENQLPHKLPFNLHTYNMLATHKKLIINKERKKSNLSDTTVWQTYSQF